jgi:RHS repeat-associated protein
MGAVLDTSFVANQIGFTGRYHDQLTGLVDFRDRYLDPALGRFISRDDDYRDGSSLYAAYFVPNGTDPTGHSLLGSSSLRTIDWLALGNALQSLKGDDLGASIRALGLEPPKTPNPSPGKTPTSPSFQDECKGDTGCDSVCSGSKDCNLSCSTASVRTIDVTDEGQPLQERVCQQTTCRDSGYPCATNDPDSAKAPAGNSGFTGNGGVRYCPEDSCHDDEFPARRVGQYTTKEGRYAHKNATNANEFRHPRDRTQLHNLYLKGQVTESSIRGALEAGGPPCVPHPCCAQFQSEWTISPAGTGNWGLSPSDNRCLNREGVPIDSETGQPLAKWQKPQTRY